jgi:predicted acylesterase/phospholipase RssA
LGEPEKELSLMSKALTAPPPLSVVRNRLDGAPCAVAGADAEALRPALPERRPSRKRRTLVLSGGGSKAIWQVGACEHLIAERGYWFDIIASISAGAINGAALAQAHNVDELNAELRHLREVWFALRGNDDVYERRRLGRLGLLLGTRSSVYGIDPLRRMLLKHIDPVRVAASPVQLRVGYVDLLSGRYRVAGNDHPALLEAVLASCALPLAFPPIPLGGGKELGVDGGVRNFFYLLDVLSVLAAQSSAQGPDEIWVLVPHVPREISQVKAHWLTLLRRCFSLLTDQASIDDIVQARQLVDLLRSTPNGDGCRDTTIRVLHPRTELHGSILDFNPRRLRAWYEDGFRTAQEGKILQF